jgi:tRNA-dihydrouridine synthase
MKQIPVLQLAPVRGVTDVVYRQAFATCFGGFDSAVAPFSQLRQGHALREGELRQVALVNNRALRTIPQILTNHGPSFIAALRELGNAGHEEVNWNLGCPYPTTAGRGRGAGLLPEPGRIDGILAEVMNQTPVKVSVKMRLGYHNPDEFLAVMEVLNRYPLVGVTLHARTADQMYEGAVDIERARQALALCRHPFTYNGDITAESGFSELRQTLPGVTGWMIGRGVLANPWLALQIKGEPMPGDEEIRTLLTRFHAQLFDGYGQWLSGAQHRHDKMLEQWAHLSKVFADPAAIFARIRHSHPGNYESTMAWAFQQALV